MATQLPAREQSRGREPDDRRTGAAAALALALLLSFSFLVLGALQQPGPVQAAPLAPAQNETATPSPTATQPGAPICQINWRQAPYSQTAAGFTLTPLEQHDEGAMWSKTWQISGRVGTTAQVVVDVFRCEGAVPAPGLPEECHADKATQHTQQTAIVTIPAGGVSAFTLVDRVDCCEIDQADVLTVNGVAWATSYFVRSAQAPVCPLPLTATPTPTATQTATPTSTATETPPPSPTASETPTATPTRTPTATQTQAPLSSVTATETATETATALPSTTATETPTSLPSATASQTVTVPATPSATETGIPTPVRIFLPIIVITPPPPSPVPPATFTPTVGPSPEVVCGMGIPAVPEYQNPYTSPNLWSNSAVSYTWWAAIGNATNWAQIAGRNQLIKLWHDSLDPPTTRIWVEVFRDDPNGQPFIMRECYEGGPCRFWAYQGHTYYVKSTVLTGVGCSRLNVDDP